MSYFLTNLSKYLNFKTKRKNHIFGTRYHPTIIKDIRHFINIIRYIYQNPVRASMVTNVHDYPYSSLGFYTGHNNHGIIISPDDFTKDMFRLGLDARSKWIEFIEHTFNNDELDILRTSLNRAKFKFTVKQYKSIQHNKNTLTI